ncbi:MAG: HAMP domain-containing histidine kinase [Clostridia bacterium]|nr:HAMP domain-containing histidine kinase [Clostridia bacterium]
MFARIMAVVTAIILLLTVAFAVLGTVTLRNQQINARLEEITGDAREIAYLASRNEASSMALLLGVDDEVQKIIDYKADTVWEKYGAYILVVDRMGRVMDNLSVAAREDPDFVASLNGEEISDGLSRVLGGEEVSVRVTVNGSPTFTVGVPFMRNGQVLGAVLIRTRAQVIEGGITDIALPLILVVACLTVASAIAIFFAVRTLMKPLKTLTGAARAISDGDFSVRVPEKGQYRETEELTHAFNTMADRISSNEASRREFVANVSHELRSPITSISGFVTGMLDGTIPEEKHAEYLKIVEGETRRLTKLISDLLALSRLEREDAMLTCTDFDICELFRQAVIRRVSDLEKKQMDLVCDFAEESCMVHADRDRIEQVIVNLLDNAIKFTPEGGNITLCVRREGDRCRMEVRDSGIGIASEDRDRIFERFFTVDRAHTSGKGTGLGLSICQRILQMHGESIRLLDTEEGAAFAFYLPAGHGKDRTDREEERDA